MSTYPVPSLLTPLPLISSTTEKSIDCTNEAAEDPNKARRNSPSCFLISCFTVGVIL